MIVTRGDGWLQKVLYLMIAVLGIYIVYKSGTILFGDRQAYPVSGTGTVQKAVEDAAVRTLSPGYAAAIEGKGREGWLSGFMEPLVPVYSYLSQTQGNGAEEDADWETETETEQTDAGQGAGIGEAGAEAEQANAGQGAGSGEAGAEAERTDAARDSVIEEGEGTENFPDSSDDGFKEQETTAAGEENEKTDEAQDEQSGAAQDEQAAEAFGRKNGISLPLLREIQDFDSLLTGFYTLDEGTSADKTLLNADELLAKDLSIRKNPENPQILIYHTHSQEEFADSVEGDVSTTIVGMGEVLAGLLNSRYGYQVIHDTGVYDLVDGVLDRSAAYDYAREAVEQILEENPTIEVVIDLHRDGVDGCKFVTEIGGKPASMIMFFNGLSRDEYGNALTWLENPYIQENLAFSLQLQLLARQQYPGFTRNIYLKAERYNLHLRARSLLIEAGTQLNTVEEEKNAMEPLAALLAQVLGGA